MSRKHNTRHDRSPSRYKDRLAARGLSRTPLMRWTGQPQHVIERELKALRDRPDTYHAS